MVRFSIPGVNDLPRVGIHQSPVDPHLVPGGLDPKIPAAPRDKTAKADTLGVAPKTGHGPD